MPIYISSNTSGFSSILLAVVVNDSRYTLFCYLEMNHKMRFAVATFAALLVLCTATIVSGHIALAYNNKFTMVFSNSGNNQERQQECGNSCTVTSSNNISYDSSGLTTPSP